MSGIEALDVVIGLIFVYLLFSLFVSIVNEILSNILNTRGNKLFNSIKELIGEKGVEKLYSDPRIKIFIKDGSFLSSVETNIQELQGKRLPDAIPEELFGEILAEVPNTEIKGHLDAVAEQVKMSKKELTAIFETAIYETKEAYKKNVRLVTLGLGLVITIIFNVDSISIFKELASDPEKAAVIAENAANYIAMNDSLSLTSDTATIEDLKSNLESLQKQQIQKVNSTLGIGWGNLPDKCGWSLMWDWVLRIFGWLITTLALSLGAPFWFDLLKKVVNIRNELAGRKSKETKEPVG